MSDQEMTSVSPSITSSGSGDAWLYQWDELFEVGENHPHATFESYGSYQKKIDQDSKQTSIIKNNHDEKPPFLKRATEDVKRDWDAAMIEHEIEQPGGEGPTILDGIEDQLNTILDRKPAVQRFLLLGMGSPHDKQCGKEAIRQYLQARHLIYHLVNKRSRAYGESSWDDYVKKCPPEIICDSSRWFEGDFEFVRNEIFAGGLEHGVLQHAPLPHVLSIADAPFVMVIMFNPDNPVRQMLADLILHSNSRPRAIVCAQASVHTPPREDVFEADRITPGITELFDEQYKGEECVWFPDIKGTTGKPWLYVDRDETSVPPEEVQASERSTPSATSRPKSTNSPFESVASPQGVEAEGSHSEASVMTSPHVWLDLPVREGGKYFYKG